MQSWKAGELEPLERALADMPPDTVLVLIARGKPPQKLVKAAEKAGGEVRSYDSPKPWEMPKWVVERAREEGLRLDSEAAKALVASIGHAGSSGWPARWRSSRSPRTPRARSAQSRSRSSPPLESTRHVFDLADALVAGEAAAALSISEQLLERGEHGSKLMFAITRRLREVHKASALLEQGVAEAQVASALGGPPWAAKKTIARAKGADRELLERALCTFADLEVDLRGGGTGGLDEDTAFSLALTRAAG